MKNSLAFTQIHNFIFYFILFVGLSIQKRYALFYHFPSVFFFNLFSKKKRIWWHFKSFPSLLPYAHGGFKTNTKAHTTSNSMGFRVPYPLGFRTTFYYIVSSTYHPHGRQLCSQSFTQIQWTKLYIKRKTNLFNTYSTYIADFLFLFNFTLRVYISYVVLATGTIRSPRVNNQGHVDLSLNDTHDEACQAYRVGEI